MVETKIVFLDVDGTITDYENRIPASAKRAIKAARAKGNRVYMCTGRSKAENPPELTEIGFDGMIGGNGAYVEDAGEVVMHQLITLDQCRHIVSWLEGRGLEFYLETNNGLFASRSFREAARPVLRLYAGRKGMAGADELETDDAMHGLVYGGELVRDDVNKVSFILSSYQDHLDSAEEFPDLKAGTWGGRDSALWRPRRQGHHEGPCDAGAPRPSRCIQRRCHCLQRCEGRYPDVRVRRHKRLHGKWRT
jgi:hydroxymethylpyrimidine pyrophosphatase-like HAD family hydrolase